MKTPEEMRAIGLATWQRGKERPSLDGDAIISTVSNVAAEIAERLDYIGEFLRIMQGRQSTDSEDVGTVTREIMKLTHTLRPRGIEDCGPSDDGIYLDKLDGLHALLTAISNDARDATEMVGGGRGGWIHAAKVMGDKLDELIRRTPDPDFEVKGNPILQVPLDPWLPPKAESAPPPDDLDPAAVEKLIGAQDSRDMDPAPVEEILQSRTFHHPASYARGFKAGKNAQKHAEPEPHAAPDPDHPGSYSATVCRGPQDPSDPKPGEPDVGLARIRVLGIIKKLELARAHPEIHPANLSSLAAELREALAVLQPSKEPTR